MEQVPRIGGLAASLDISAVLQARIEADLHRRAPSLSQANVRMTALILETCIEALTHRAVVERPDWLETGEIERETLGLLEPYIERVLTAASNRPAGARTRSPAEADQRAGGRAAAPRPGSGRRRRRDRHR